MAMNINTKLGVAVGILIALGGVAGVRIVAQGDDSRAHSFEEKTADLPTIQQGDLEVQAADRIAITVPAAAAEGGESAVEPIDVVLVKTDDAWALERPLAYPADRKRVDSLLSNLAKLKVMEQVDGSTDAYGANGLSDERARHVVVSNDGKAIVDVYVGDSGSRGQMMRVAGRDGVFAVSGYSKRAVELDANGWRDKAVLTFDPTTVTAVKLTNANGIFDFKKESGAWTGRAGRAGRRKATRPIPHFDPAKVTQLLGAFKGLKALGFGDGESLAAAGLEKPQATLTVSFGNGESRQILVGGVSTGSNHWAKTGAGPQIFNIGAVAASWATAGPQKFAKPEPATKP